MTVIVFPFHQDERLPENGIELPAGLTPLPIDPVLPAGDRWERLAALYGALADAVAAAVGEGSTAAVVSGDCLSALGTLAGVQRAGVDPAVVWFDAHGDVHTLASSTSGYLGGMALRMALGADAGKLTEPLGLRPLPEDRAVLVDARDLDPAEAEYLAGSLVRRLPVEQVTAACLPDGPLVLHIDVDVIDAAEVPGLRFPVSGGPGRGAVLAALRLIRDTGRVAAFDIACPWHPAAPGSAEADIRVRLLADLLEDRSV